MPPDTEAGQSAPAIAFAVDTEKYNTCALRLVADLSDQGVRLIAPPLFESEADSTIRRLVYSRTLTA